MSKKFYVYDVVMEYDEKWGHVVAVFDTEQEADDYVENTHPCTYDSWFEVREE